jgi:hypothetical protein
VAINVKARKEKKIKKEKEKYYLYQETRISYISWVMLNAF